MLMRALLLLLATVLALLPSWLRADWDGTEGRRVQIALEMLRAGNWMEPTIGGESTWANPPLHYWLLMLLTKCFGTNIMMLRLPAVLAVFLSSFVAGELLRRWFGVTAGWIVAFGIICSPMVVFWWPTAEMEPLFASLLGMSMWLLAAGVGHRRAAMVLASGLLAGLAFLQAGLPYCLFALGAYLVWWRHRRMQFALWHFVPMATVIASYLVPLWAWYVSPTDMIRVAIEESVGSITESGWWQLYEAPTFWLRAMLVLMPFSLWCFWEWRGARDVRMSANDLTLRMCSGSAVLAVALLTFFPGCPTSYLLPNVMLFTFAVAPAVAHFFGHKGAVPSFARGAILLCGCLGAAALIAIPFIPHFGDASVGLALAAAILPVAVRSSRHVVLAVLLLPIVASWTVGLERSLRWHHSEQASVGAGQLMGREIDALGAASDLGSYGPIDSGVLLASGLWPAGDEKRARLPDTRWLLHESSSRHPVVSEQHVMRWRMCTSQKTFVVLERQLLPK